MDSSQGTQENEVLHPVFQDGHNASHYSRRQLVHCDKGPQLRMFEHAEQNNHGFLVACDWIPTGSEVKKMYASYAKCENFIQDTLVKVIPQDRHFYELVQGGRHCKPYLDIEWNGPDDSEKTVVHHVVEALTR